MKKTSLRFVLFLVFLAGCGPVLLAPTDTPIVSPLPNIEVTGTSVVTRGPTATTAPTFEPIAEPTFPTLPPPNIQEAHVEKIQMMDETSGWAWATDRAYEGYLLHTADGGLTWQDATPEKDALFGSFSSFMLDAQTAWLVLADEELARTSDGGQTWDVINPNLFDELVKPYRDWYRLRFADAQHGWLSAGYTAAGAHEHFYETQDGGVTWDPADFQTLPSAYSGGTARNELAFWIVTDVLYYDLERFILAPALDEQEGTVELFVSTDWGGSWKNVVLPSPESLVGSLYTIENISQPVFFDPQQGVLTVTLWDRDGTNTFQLFVYGTSDGGQSWRLTAGPSTLEGAPSGISFLSLRDAVFICGTNLCVTHDSGNSWRALDFGIATPTEGEPVDFQLDFVNRTTGWLLIGMNDALGWPVSSRLLTTADGGVTWTELSVVINP